MTHIRVFTHCQSSQEKLTSTVIEAENKKKVVIDSNIFTTNGGINLKNTIDFVLGEILEGVSNVQVTLLLLLN